MHKAPPRAQLILIVGSVCTLAAVAYFGTRVAILEAVPVEAEQSAKVTARSAAGMNEMPTPTPMEVALAVPAPIMVAGRSAAPQAAANSPAKPLKTSTIPPGKTAPRPPRPLRDPVAREALRLVGASSDADAYWMQAINDPDVPAKERADLIEDLNEEGIASPPTTEDLPIIANRLALIEGVADQPLDKANADAFKEAYKDLANLYAKLKPQ